MPNLIPTKRQNLHTFKEGAKVWFRNFSKYESKWALGIAPRRLGSCMYEVEPNHHPGVLVRTCIDQLNRHENPPQPSNFTSKPSRTHVAVDSPICQYTETSQSLPTQGMSYSPTAQSTPSAMIVESEPDSSTPEVREGPPTEEQPTKEVHQELQRDPSHKTQPLRTSTLNTVMFEIFYIRL